jgi:hypothetical protein
MTAGRTLSRWISLCAAALVLIQLGAMAHLAAAPHGVCWEHGVVVELDGAPARTQALPMPAGPGVDRAPGRTVRSDSHPHCPALWVTRAARAEVQISPGTELARGVPTRVHAPESVAVAADSTLRNAPKHSPPV